MAGQTSLLSVAVYFSTGKIHYIGLSTHRLTDIWVSPPCLEAVNSDAMGIQIQIFTRNVFRALFQWRRSRPARVQGSILLLSGGNNYLDYTTISMYPIRVLKRILQFIKQQKDIFHLDMFMTVLGILNPAMSLRHQERAALPFHFELMTDMT